jgi:hypothetical protein
LRAVPKKRGFLNSQVVGQDLQFRTAVGMRCQVLVIVSVGIQTLIGKTFAQTRLELMLLTSRKMEADLFKEELLKQLKVTVG